MGGLAGGAFLRDVPGVDFVLTALFVVLAMDAYPDRTTLALALGGRERCRSTVGSNLPAARVPTARFRAMRCVVAHGRDET